MKFKILLISAFIYLITFFNGCIFSPASDDNNNDNFNKKPKPQTNVGNLLHNFSLAHELRDLDLYAACLHDSFEFYFSEKDIKEPGETTLNRTDDINSTEHMFYDQKLIDIQFEVDTIQTYISTENPAWTEVLATIILKLLTKVEPYEEGQMVNGFVKFFVDKKIDNKDTTCTIIRIEDHTG